LLKCSHAFIYQNLILAIMKEKSITMPRTNYSHIRGIWQHSDWDNLFGEKLPGEGWISWEDNSLHMKTPHLGWIISLPAIRVETNKINKTELTTGDHIEDTFIFSDAELEEFKESYMKLVMQTNDEQCLVDEMVQCLEAAMDIKLKLSDSNLIQDVMAISKATGTMRIHQLFHGYHPKTLMDHAEAAARLLEPLLSRKFTRYGEHYEAMDIAAQEFNRIANHREECQPNA